MTRHPDVPVEGACICGECRVRVSIAPIITMACHCTGCQKLSASAFSLTAMVPVDGFEVIAGRTQIGALHGDNSDQREAGIAQVHRVRDRGSRR